MSTSSFDPLKNIISDALSNDPYAAFTLGLEAYRAGERLLSLKNLAASLRIFPGDDIRRALLRQVASEETNRLIALFNSGDSDAAFEGFSAIAEYCPEFLDARANLQAVTNHILTKSVELHNNGDISNADKGYRNVLRHFPNNTDALHLSALVSKRRGNVLGCLKTLSKLMTENTYTHSIHHNLSNTIGEVIEKGDTMLADGEENGAHEHFLAVATCLDGLSDPNNPLSKRGYVINSFLPPRLRAELVYANTHGHILFDELRDYLPANSFVLECGGADGSDSIKLAEIFPQGRIFSVEASSREYDILSRRTAPYDNIKAFNVALSDHDGTSDIFILKKDIGQNTILEPNYTDINNYERHEIPCFTLDSLASKNNIDHIDFMWLDMEGFELQALRYGENILSTTIAIYAEVSPDGMGGHKNSCHYDDLREWLGTRGFVVERELLPWSGAGNVLFVRRERSISRELRRFR